MKKWLCLLAAAALCTGMLAACGGSAEGNVNLSTAGSDKDIQITPQLHEKEYKSQDGKLTIGKYSYTVPAMTGPADDATSAAVVDAFNDGVTKVLEEESKYWDEAMEDAQSYYDSYGSEGWSSGGYWVSELSYMANQTDRMVSIRYQHYVFSGGAHGYTYFTSRLFDLQTGLYITLDEITDDPETLAQAVTDEILRQIDENDMAIGYGYWSDYPAYVAGWMDGYSAYFREDGALQVIFPAYELASYAAGPQEFVVSQEVYGPYLNDYGKALLEVS